MRWRTYRQIDRLADVRMREEYHLLMLARALNTTVDALRLAGEHDDEQKQREAAARPLQRVKRRCREA